MQPVVCHEVGRDSSAIKFNRVEIAFSLTVVYWLNHEPVPSQTPPRWPSGKASALRAADAWFDSRFRRGCSCGSSDTGDLHIGTPVATLSGSWRCGVSAGTDWSGVSMLSLDEIESLICSFCLSVAARTIVRADLSLRHTSMFLESYKQPTSNNNSHPKDAQYSILLLRLLRSYLYLWGSLFWARFLRV